MAMVIAVRLLLSLMLFCWKTRSLIIRTASIRRLRTFVSPIGAVADNAGIRPLPNVHPSLVALWKVSNVAIFEGIALHRAASEPVSVWLKQNHQHQHPHIIPTILFSSTLAASISGIVLVAVSDTSVVRLTRVEYVGVLACPMADVVLLQEKLQTSINNALNNHDNDQKTTPSSSTATSTDRPLHSVSSISVEVEVVQSSESGTHNGLHLVRVSLKGSPVLTLPSPIPKASTSPVESHIQPYATNSVVERLLAGCVVAKAPCVMDGKTPLLSLVGVDAVVEGTDINDSNGNNGHTNPPSSRSPGSSPDLSPDLSPVPGRVAVAVAQEVPVKFTKYMRRENILHTRLTSHSQGQQDTTTTTESTTTTTAAPTTSTTTAATATTTTAPTTTTTSPATTTTATEATFMGLSLLIPADALRPRPSR